MGAVAWNENAIVERAGATEPFQLNANLEALRQHTDWLVEVLMVPDANAAAGYLFRATVKRLSDGRILASGMSTLEEFRSSPPRTKIVYDDTGYKFVPDEAPKPTVGDYAQSVAIKLLVDFTPTMSALAKP